MVEQLGLAMIISSDVSCWPLSSGTINLWSWLMRQAEELSMTRVPAAANFGAHSREASDPAEKRAMSGAILTASSIDTIGYSCIPNEMLFPTDLLEATGINSVIGKLRSARTFSISRPTIPVAPTIATLMSQI